MTTKTDPFALTAAEEKLILQSSIERVFNNAIFIGHIGESDLKEEEQRERASILWQDCEELKWVARKLWEREKDNIFKRQLQSGGKILG